MRLARYSEDGLFTPRRIAGELGTTGQEVARAAGLEEDIIQRKDHLSSDRTQRRLREMVEIIDKAEPRFGSALVAYAWYRSQPIQDFSGWTAMQLVKLDRAREVLEFIDSIDAGVYA